MKPNLPSCKANTVIIDKNIHNEAKKLLRSIGINVIETFDIPEICDCTSTHPDMQFLLLGAKKALTVNQCYDYYRKLLPDFQIIAINNVFSPYPNDSILNVTIVGKYCFATKQQWQALCSYIDCEPVFIKQGYSKCNICVINENTILTSDRGIYGQAQKFGFKAYFLPSEEITLTGYKNGFWGGCCGLIDKNKMFFNGDINKLSCYSELQEILKKEKIEPIYHRAGELCDNGSILTIL